ncbi:RHS repeat domain-containing protein [Pirellulaceae bacterium SH467]
MEIDVTTASGTAGTTLWALTDHLGSVRDLLDNNGVVREHNVFDSFGRLIREVDYNSSGTAISSTDAAAVDSIFGYTGRDWDSDIGMQYNRARWYDPQTGRWLSQDPIGFAAGDSNLYRYVGNSPTYWIDPSGLTWENTPNWHHLVPQELRNIFGDKIDQAWNGWFLRAGDHSALHTAGWNRDWNKWVDNFREANGRDPKLSEAKKFMKDLMADPKYKCILDRGFKAGWSHAKWLEKSGRVKQKIGALLAEKLVAVTGKTVAKKTGKGILASIPIVSIGFSVWDYPARASEFGTGVAVGMTVLDNIPIIDIALAGAEGIDAVQQARIRAESDALQEQEKMINDLMREAQEAGVNCQDED